MKTEYQILQELTRLENLNVNPDFDFLTRISALQWVLDGDQVGNVAKPNACAQLCDVSDIEMKCPECGADMKEWVLNYQCRNLDCRFKVNKKFS